MTEAIRKTLLRRGDANSAWSMAWRMNAWARLEDGDHAYALLKLILAGPTQSNLLDADDSLLVDANFGATAGIAEMLLQSHAGEISLLPALPRAWTNGHVEGLRARGGLEVAITWRDGRATAAVLKSALAGRHAIRVPNGQHIARILSAQGDALPLQSGPQGTVLLDTLPARTYRIEFGP